MCCFHSPSSPFNLCPPLLFLLCGLLLVINPVFIGNPLPASTTQLPAQLARVFQNPLHKDNRFLYPCQEMHVMCLPYLESALMTYLESVKLPWLRVQRLCMMLWLQPGLVAAQSICSSSSLALPYHGLRIAYQWTDCTSSDVEVRLNHGKRPRCAYSGPTTALRAAGCQDLVSVP